MTINEFQLYRTKVGVYAFVPDTKPILYHLLPIGTEVWATSIQRGLAWFDISGRRDLSLCIFDVECDDRLEEVLNPAGQPVMVDHNVA